MPNYKGHLGGGLGAFVVVLLLVGISSVSVFQGVEYFASTIMGSLFPDIDTKSKGQRLFYFLLLGIFIVLFIRGDYFLQALLSFVALFPLLVHHRGVFHQLWFILCVPIPLVLACAYYNPHLVERLVWNSMFFCAGAISHLWLDVGLKRMLRL